MALYIENTVLTYGKLGLVFKMHGDKLGQYFVDPIDHFQVYESKVSIVLVRLASCAYRMQFQV